MRDRHCLQCGKLITHFGKGWKYSVIKMNGGYYHEICYDKRNKRTYNKEKQKIYNRRYYLKNKDRINTRCKEYSIGWYLRNRERILNMHKSNIIETDDVYRVPIL